MRLVMMVLVATALLVGAPVVRAGEFRAILSDAGVIGEYELTWPERDFWFYDVSGGPGVWHDPVVVRYYYRVYYYDPWPLGRVVFTWSTPLWHYSTFWHHCYHRHPSFVYHYRPRRYHARYRHAPYRRRPPHRPAAVPRTRVIPRTYDHSRRARRPVGPSYGTPGNRYGTTRWGYRRRPRQGGGPGTSGRVRTPAGGASGRPDHGGRADRGSSSRRGRRYGSDRGSHGRQNREGGQSREHRRDRSGGADGRSNRPDRTVGGPQPHGGANDQGRGRGNRQGGPSFGSTKADRYGGGGRRGAR